MTQDYLTYVSTGSQQKLDYVEYSGNKEKRSGVFNANGLLSYDSENMRHLKPEIKQLVNIAIKLNKPWYNAYLKFCSEVQKTDVAMREILI